MTGEEVPDFGPAQTFFPCGPQSLQDAVGYRVASGVAEDVPGRIFGIAPHCECRSEVLILDGFRLIHDGVERRQAQPLCLRASYDGAEETGLALRQGFVDLRPRLPRRFAPPNGPGLPPEADGGIETPAQVPQRLTGYVAAERERLRATHHKPQEAVGKTVGGFRVAEMPQQLRLGDVADDRHMGARGPRGAVFRHRPEPVAVPGLANRRGHGVALPAHDLEKAGEFALYGE